MLIKPHNNNNKTFNIIQVGMNKISNMSIYIVVKWVITIRLRTMYKMSKIVVWLLHKILVLVRVIIIVMVCHLILNSTYLKLIEIVLVFMINFIRN
jgi:hypothetical protein